MRRSLIIKKQPVTQADIDRWIANGDGQGSGADYRPWTHIRDVPSRGHSHRVPSLDHRRLHHFLSDLEYCRFMLRAGSPVIDQIREQFALVPQSETIAIAKRLRVRHPRIPYGGPRAVMTIDQMVTIRLQNGDFHHVAYSIKYCAELKGRHQKRIEQKHDVARAYCRERGIGFEIETEEGIPRIVVTNLAFLRSGLGERRLNDLKPRALDFLESFARHWRMRDLDAVLRRVAAAIQVEELDEARLLFNWLAWRRDISLDLTRPLGPIHPVALVDERFGGALAMEAAG